MVIRLSVFQNFHLNVKKRQSDDRQAVVDEIWMQKCVLKFVEMSVRTVLANSINPYPANVENMVSP